MIFDDKRVLVVGDSILDETISGKAVGLSLESPTLKIDESSREVTFGGAANVVQNILALGAKCTYITPLAFDGYSQYYDNWDHKNLRLVRATGISSNTVKTRVWIEKSGERYKYLQINKTNKFEVVNKLDSVSYHMSDADVVLLVDYGLGMFGDVNYIIKEAKKSKIPVIASSQVSSGRNRMLLFSESNYLCMNEHEFRHIKESISRGPSRFANALSLPEGRPQCVTLGSKGSVFTDGAIVYKTPGFKVDCIDPCGAGDSFLAAFSLCINDVTEESLRFCNAWAAMSTTKIGTTSPTLKEAHELLRGPKS